MARSGFTWAEELKLLAQVDEAKEEEQIRQDAAKKGGDPRPALANLWIQRGFAAYNQSDFPRAITCFEQALGISRAVRDREGEGITLSNMGHIYSSLSQYDKAIKYYEQSLVIFREVEDRPSESIALHGIGSAYSSLSRYDKAIEYYEQALAILREVKDRAGEGATLSNLGLAYSSLSNYDKAIEYYERALAILREVKDRRGEGKTLSNLGLTYASLSQYDKAISYYERALAIHREVQDRPGEGSTLNNLGAAYSSLNQYSKSIEYHERALAIHREVQNRVGEGVAVNGLGLAYHSLDQHNHAIEYFRQALLILREVKDRAGEGATLGNLGLTYDSLSQYDKAISYYEQALAIHREVKDRAGEASTLNGLGFAYRNLSQYNEAIRYSEQALTIQREVKDRAGEGATLNNLGMIYHFLGKDTEAIKYYNEALLIHREVKNQTGEGSALNNLGSSYDSLNQNDKAISYYEQALAIYREVKNQSGEGTALNNLGLAYQSLRQYEKAINFYEQALPIHREIKNRTMEGTTHSNLGLAYDSLGQYDKAMGYYVIALAIRRKVKDRAGESATLNNLMTLSKRKKQKSLSICYGKQAVNIYQAIRNELRDLDKELRYSFLKSIEGTYRTLAELLLTEGRAREAEQVLKMLKEEEFFEFVNRDRQAAPQLLSTIAYSPSEAPLVAQYTKLADEMTRLAQQRDALKSASSQATTQDVQHATQLDTQLQAASAAFQTFLHNLPAQFDQQAPQEAWAPPSELQQTLAAHEPGTVGIWTLVGEKQTWLVMVTPQGAKIFPVAIAREELTHKVQLFRDMLKTSASNPLPLAQELYQLLLAPMRKDLETVGARTLLWSLDGPLRYIPIGALHDGQQYVVEQYRTGVFTLAGQQVLTTDAAPDWKAAGFGVSKAHGIFKPLAAVPAELNAIIKRSAHDNGAIPGVIRLDQQFTEATFRTLLDAKYPVVHVASHFHLQPGNETQSFLLLGDGSQLSVDRLKQYHFGGTELVTLSACETGVGGDLADGAAQFSGGKEVESFAMLLQYRGARAVMASLWQVDDPSTKELMAAFYRYRQAHRAVSKLEALQQAQLQLLHGAKPEAQQVAKRGGRGASAIPLNSTSAALPQQTTTPYAHPYYWAPFILIGNGQ